MPSHVSIFPYSYYGNDWGIQAIAGFSAKAYMDYFDFTGDLNFLRYRAYPFVRAVGDFYQSYSIDNGKFITIPYACAQEGCTQAGSESGSLRASNNTAYDLAFYKRTFRALLEWSTILGIDANMRPTWQHLLDYAVDFVTTVTYNGITVFSQASFKDGMPSPGNNNCARYPIVYFNAMHPGEEIDLDSSPDLIKIGANTVDYVNSFNSWSPTNGMCLAWPPASRVVQSATNLLSNFQKAVGEVLMPNFLPYINNRPDAGLGCNMENSGANVAINDLLVSRHGHGETAALRFFPGGWPQDQPVSFQNILTKGAFRVSASANGLGDGKPVYYTEPITITSVVGNPCVFQNPFGNITSLIVLSPTGPVQLNPVAGFTGRYRFITNPLTVYRLVAQ
jgi:hypothetical protein